MFKSEEEFTKYFQSDEFKKKAEEYLNSPECKAEMKALKKDVKKNKRKRFLQALVKNIFNILALVTSIAALIVAILSYLK